MHRQEFLCYRLQRRNRCKKAWQHWMVHYSKRCTSSNLCARIFEVKLGRRVLRAWHAQAIERLLPAAISTANLYRQNVARYAYSLWRRFLAKREYQARVNRAMSSSHKGRIFGYWRQFVGQIKQSRVIRSTMLKRVLRPIWLQWRNKVSNVSTMLFNRL